MMTCADIIFGCCGTALHLAAAIADVQVINVDEDDYCDDIMT